MKKIANEYQIFKTPNDIILGRGSIAYLKEIQGNRAIIISDNTMSELGIVEQICEQLRLGGKTVAVYDGVEPEPTSESILNAVKEYTSFQPDIIVGLGGGSCIDASKCFRIFYEHPELTFGDLREMGRGGISDIPKYSKTVHIAIPSTSGTGSEATKACIITDTATHTKHATFTNRVIPDVAILDPDLADTMPVKLRVDTALDALTHAIESYVSKKRNDFSMANSLKAIGLIMEYLLPAVHYNNHDAKEHLHYAACLAGIGFSNSSNGLAHTIGDKAGHPYRLTHGRACIIALPYVMKFNGYIIGEEYAKIARYLGFSGNDDIAAQNFLIEKIQKLQSETKVERCYKDAGVPKEDYYAKVPYFAEQSVIFPPTLNNPRTPTLDELKELYVECYEGMVE